MSKITIPQIDDKTNEADILFRYMFCKRERGIKIFKSYFKSIN